MCLTILEIYALKSISTFVWKIRKAVLVILASNLSMIFLKVFVVRRLEFLIHQVLVLTLKFLLYDFLRLRLIVIFSLLKNRFAKYNFSQYAIYRKRFLKISLHGGLKMSRLDGSQNSLIDGLRKVSF